MNVRTATSKNLYQRIIFHGDTCRNNFNPDIKELEIQVGDLILICSDGVYGNGKWSKVNEALKGEMLGAYVLSDVFQVAKENAHDNYSAILIRIGPNEPEDKTDTYLFKISRHVQDENGWNKEPNEPIEYFRTRKEAMARLMKLGCYSQTPENVRHSCGRCPDGNGAKWIRNEQPK